MSTWLITAEDDIEIDGKLEEVYLYIESDKWGNTYKTITFEQIKKIYRTICQEQKKLRKAEK